MIQLDFDHWPDKALFPNMAGNQLHWAQRAKSRKVARQEAYCMALNKKPEKPFERATIEIQITAKDYRRHDGDSFAYAVKAWVDGMVDAGILEDDNYFCVPEITIRFGGVSTEAVSIIVKELGCIK